MWSEPVATAAADVRHEARNEHALAKFGWRRHNLRRFGEQEVLDKGLRITTAFVKPGGGVRRAGHGYGGGWALQINASEVQAGSLDAVDGMVSVFWYLGHNGGGSSVSASEVTPSVQVRLSTTSHFTSAAYNTTARSDYA